MIEERGNVEQESFIYKNILENMSGGVMTIGLDGRIITFNPAASRILDRGAEEVLERKFAAVFFGEEVNDAFNQTVLDAIYESSVSHNRTVEFFTGARTLYLSVTTSFLQFLEDDQLKRVGVILVFDDITEVKKLRDVELALTDSLRSAVIEKEQLYLELQKYTRNLEKKVVELEIEIDSSKKAKDVSMITESDYFKTLLEKIDDMR